MSDTKVMMMKATGGGRRRRAYWVDVVVYSDFGNT